MTPRVSIGLPVYNGQRFVEEALHSLLKQTYRDFEIIISDNGSNDRTEAICRECASTDDRVRYYRNDENRGAAWNFKHVVDLSKGEYFKWAGHDDICAPEYVERCVDVLDRMPQVVLCYTKSILIDECGTPLRQCRDGVNLRSASAYERFRHLIANLGLSNPMFGVIRRETLKATPLIGSYVASDIILLAEIALRGEIYEIPECLFFRRDHPQKSSRANPSFGDLAAWYDPANKGREVFREWKLLSEYLSSIGRVRIGHYDRLRCYIHMAKWFRHNWTDLKADLLTGLKKSLTWS